MMEESEEPELFDMEVVSENAQEQCLDYRFSTALHTHSPQETQQTNVKRIIYIEEDSSDTSVESDSDVNVETHHKHMTQKITIQNVAENNKVFLKRKLELSPNSDRGNSPKVRYSDFSESSKLINLSHLNTLLDNVTNNKPVLKQSSSDSSFESENTTPITYSLSRENFNSKPPENYEMEKCEDYQKLSTKPTRLLSYYPSAFKVGLVQFSALRGIQEASDLFKIPKNVLEFWVEIQESLKDSSYVEWESDMFLDVIISLYNNDLVQLKDLIKKRETKCDSVSKSKSALKWALDWCRQFKFELNSIQEVTEMTSLKFPGTLKAVSEPKEATSSDSKPRIFSPEFKLEAVRYADKHSFKACAEKYNLKTATVRRWFCERIVLEKRMKPQPTSKITFSRKRNEILDDELSEWYKSMAVKGKTTRQSLLFSKARSLARKLNLEDFEPTIQWYNEWSKNYLKTSNDSNTKVPGQQDTPVAVKMEWDKVSPDSDDLPTLHRNSRTSPESDTKKSVTKSSNFSRSLNGNSQCATVDYGLEDSSDSSFEKDQAFNRKQNSNYSSSTTRENNTHPSDTLPVSCRENLQLDSECRVSVENLCEPSVSLTQGLHSKNNSFVSSKTSRNCTADESALLGKLDIDVFVDKVNSDLAKIRHLQNSKLELTPVSSTLAKDSPNETTKAPDTFDEISDMDTQRFKEHTNDLAHDKMETPDKKISAEVKNDLSEGNTNCTPSGGPSRNLSTSDLSGESSVYSSYDSNSSTVTESNSKQDNLSGSFQQIFLKFAQDGNQPINDQKSLMGIACGDESISLEDQQAKPVKETVQSTYVLRNKTPKTEPGKSNVKKAVKSHSPQNASPEGKITPDALSNKSTMLPRRLGYSSATFKKPGFHSINRENKKQKGNRRRSRKRTNSGNKSKNVSNSLKEKVKTEKTDFAQADVEEFQAPTYPACFQKRIIEAAEISGVESVCTEFGLSAPLVTDWMHSKNSIKMLSQLENFQDWELDLYVLVHKLNVKAQRLSLSDLLDKGAEVLKALNLSDCFTFQKENAMDWCERFGVGLSDSPTEQIVDQVTSTSADQVHHRQKHSTDFMIEACKYAKENTISEAHKNFGIPISTLRSWILKDVESRHKTSQKLETENEPANQGVLSSDQGARVKRNLRKLADKPEMPSTDIESTEDLKGHSEMENQIQNNDETFNELSENDLKDIKPLEVAGDNGALKTKQRHLKDLKGAPVGKAKVPVLVKNYKQRYMNYRGKYVNPGCKRYTDEFRQQVVEYAKLKGVPAAALKYQLSLSVLYHWGGNKGTRRVKFSPAIKAKAMAYADKYTVAEASQKFKISTSLLFSWRFQRRLSTKEKERSTQQSKLPNKIAEANEQTTKQTKEPVRDQKSAASRTAPEAESKPNLTSIKAVKNSESPNIPLSVTPRIQPLALSYNLEDGFKLNYPNYTPAFVHEVVTYANMYGVKWASRKYSIEYKVVNGWLLRYENAYKSGRLGAHTPYSKKYQDKVVSYALETSCKSASEHFALQKSVIYSWIREANKQKKQPEKPIKKESPGLESIDKELLSWCQLIQANDSSVRVPKIMSKAKALAQQMNIDESLVNHEWYKDWSLKYKEELTQVPKQDSESPKTTPVKKLRLTKNKEPKIKTESCEVLELSVTEDEHSEHSSLHKTSSTTQDTGLDIKHVNDETLSSEVTMHSDSVSVSALSDSGSKNSSESTKPHTHFTRKLSRKFCKFCPYDHHEHGGAHHKEMANSQCEIATDEDVTRMDSSECESVNNIVEVRECSEQDEENSNSLISTVSKTESTPSISGRDKSVRACKSALKFSSSLSSDSSDILVAESVNKDDKSSGNSIDVVITDPGWVFCNWLKEVNEYKQILSNPEVIAKLEFIVLRTHEDYFDNWLFRYYVKVVNQVNHPIVNTKAVSTVLGLNGYIAADVRLEILAYADRRNADEASKCFQVSLDKITEWQESKTILMKVLKVQDLFVTSPKNLHIDLDIYEWYLKNMEKVEQIDEEQLKTQAVTMYLAHNGKSIKRWYKWFLERFQKVNAHQSIQNDILKNILRCFDCNISLTTENVIALYEEKISEQEIKPIFATSQQWFQQFFANYSDCLRFDTKVPQLLPTDLVKESHNFCNYVRELRQGVDLSCLGSVDEFPIWFSCKQQSQVTDTEVLPQCGFGDADGVVLFACLASGSILSPFLTFRSSSKKNSNQLAQHIVTDPVLSQWLQKVWLVEVTQPNSVIILDSYSPHTSATFHQIAKQHNVQLALVPAGCNSSVHPIATNLRVRFQTLLQELRMKRFSDTVLGRPDIVSLVNDAYCEIYQERESVRKAFQTAGIVSSDDLLTNQFY